MSRPRRLLVGALGGALLSAGLPPFGWWPLALAGVAVAALVVQDRPLRARAGFGMAVGIGFLAPGLFWMTEFSAPGYVLAVLIESAFIAFGLTVAPPGRWSALGLTGALVLVEALRGAWPFGGVPIATLAQTQIGGPLALASRVGGSLLVAALVVLGGTALAALARGRLVQGTALAALVGVTAFVGQLAPRGNDGADLEVAIVQGGGEQGTRASETSERAVFRRHLEASEEVAAGVDLVLWPEDVVDVDGLVEGTDAAADLAALARRLGTTVVAGVVEGFDDEFRNASVAWGPDGEVVARYDKNVRVPFGEYIPFRSLIRRVADLSAVPRDAATSDDEPILSVPPGDLGVMISYEVFFPRRARDAMASGAEVLLAPTNASSYSTGQMPALELGAARMRALETGRVVLQAAPTGYSAVVGPDGSVRQVSDLGAPDALAATVAGRSGRTPYTRLGDGPFVVGAAAALAVAWAVHSKRRTAPDTTPVGAPI